MAMTPAELQKAGKYAINHYLKNTPIDQVEQNLSLFKRLTSKKKPFPATKEYIVEQLRTNYGEDGQWFSGDDTVTYNSRDPLAQAKFSWYSYHDGISLSDEELLRAGIVVTDEHKTSKATDAEKVQLSDLLQENMEVLRLGAQEAISRQLHLDGSANPKALVGLDGFLPLDNTTGVIGGLDRAANNWWRHHVATGITEATVENQMEKSWRACIKRGIGMPNFILAGADFIDAYRNCGLSNTGIHRQVTTTGKGGINLDVSTEGLYYKGVPIEYAPEFDDNFGGVVTPTIPWSKRCYFINDNHFFLRTIKGNDFSSRTPPRDKGQYVTSWAILWRGGLSMNLPSAHAALALA